MTDVDALCCDATLVSLLSREGLPQGCTADEDGTALAAAKCRKQTTYPELLGGPQRLPVLGAEPGCVDSELRRPSDAAAAGFGTPLVDAGVGGRPVRHGAVTGLAVAQVRAIHPYSSCWTSLVERCPTPSLPEFGGTGLAISGTYYI